MPIVRYPRASLVACVALLAAMVGQIEAAAGQELVLRRVMLSTGGVGYFEYDAEVNGDATLSLPVDMEAVDDVLKSIIVFDDRGRVGIARLPGRDALDHRFRSLPFDIDDLESMVHLLDALKGETIRVSGGQSLEGQILGVRPDVVRLPDDLGTVTRHRVSVMTDAGIRHFVLEDVADVAFANPTLARQVQGALTDIATMRAGDARTIAIDSRGEGRRRVVVGFVAPVPLWKSTYRLSVAREGGSSDLARLFGWAVLENMTGHDWHDVELTVASGNPVTFRQALYETYYVARPNVPVEVAGRILPVPDSGGIAYADDEFRRKRAELMPEPGVAMERSAVMAEGARLESLESDVMAMAAPPAIAQAAVGVSPEQGAGQVVFRVQTPVNVAAGQSVIVPVVEATLSGGLVSVYQPMTEPRHPLVSVDLVNELETGLPAGAVTLYQRGAAGTVSYVGDARLSPLPAGDSRLLSFAVDEAVRIDREERSQQTIVSGKISRGVLSLLRRERATTSYRIKAPTTEDRQLLIEHRRRPGWDLISPAGDDVTITDMAYRLPYALRAGEDIKVDVVLARPLTERLSLLDLNDRQVRAFAQATELGAPVRRAFEQIAVLRAEIDSLAENLDNLEAERTEIYADQDRLRDNLNRVPRGEDLHRRYLSKLSDQEDRLEGLEVEHSKLRRALADAEEALKDYVQSLELASE